MSRFQSDSLGGASLSVFVELNMRAERAQLKPCGDDEMIARGQRSAALGQRHQMNPSPPFSRFGFPESSGKPNLEKGGVGGVGGLHKAAASAFGALRRHESAPLPRATIMLPLLGTGRPPRRWPALACKRIGTSGAAEMKVVIPGGNLMISQKLENCGLESTNGPSLKES